MRVRTLRELRRGRLKGRKAQGGRDLALLICSDFHVGEYSKDLERIAYVKQAHRFDREFCAFLEYYAVHRQAEQPWRLILNGDFIDFIAVTFQPSAEEVASQGGFDYSADEARFGLDNTSPKCVWKLERIAERHATLFVYLADFVARGNHIALLYGNHDVEFYWPAVQQRFVDLVVDAYFGAERVDGVDPDAFRARIRFHPWFYYVPGEIYIEHGNQYDEFSSFENRLLPLMPHAQAALAMPISHQVIRYFVNQYRGFRSHDKDAWTLKDYLHWLRGQGWQNTLHIGLLYGTLFTRIWAYARTFREASPELTALQDENTRCLEALEISHEMRAGTLKTLNALRRRPVEMEWGKTLQLSAVDKYFLVLLLGSGLLTVLVGGFFFDVSRDLAPTQVGSALRLLAFAVVLLLGVVGWQVASWVTALFAGGRLSTAVAPKLDAAAAEIARTLDVKHVVMGHSHRPGQVRLAGQKPRFYTNTGAWLAPRKRERHDPDCRSPICYGIYEPQTGMVSLYRWCTREMAPVPFSAGVRAESLESERIHPAEVDPEDLLAGLRAREARRRRG